ncbi:MAG: GTP 3',8-cyclase MoaA, partial [Deltaproteobacteria bacterium]|nr:GTP 3',8-cyclase MoaA [Deltaproteobacteria bacterium]
EKFKQISRWGDINRAFEGIEEAKRVGFKSIKLNAVIQRGINDGEVEDLLQFAASNGLILRLIELMPIGPACDQKNLYIPLSEIKQRLQKKYSLFVSGVCVGSGPAVYYKIAELKTLIGFISPVSQPFCKDCNRIRISSDGRFQDCLAYDGTFSFRELLRDPAFTDEMIARETVSLLQGKRESHNNFTQTISEKTPCMYGIGG